MKQAMTFDMVCRGVVVIAMIVGAIIGIPQLMMTPRAASAQTNNDRTFQSEEDGFRLQIPEGWVIQDNDIIPEPDIDFEFIALLCLENEALPGIGGEHNCQSGALTDSVGIFKWSDLQSMPEFQVEPNTNITTNDLVALWIKYLQGTSTGSAHQIKIQNTTDVDEFTKIVDMTYQAHDTAGTILPFDDYTAYVENSNMFVLSPDRNTGYQIVTNRFLEDPRQQSPAVQEVFNSFELVG